MVINHLLNGMILQVLEGKKSTSPTPLAAQIGSSAHHLGKTLWKPPEKRHVGTNTFHVKKSVVPGGGRVFFFFFWGGESQRPIGVFFFGWSKGMTLGGKEKKNWIRIFLEGKK